MEQYLIVDYLICLIKEWPYLLPYYLSALAVGELLMFLREKSGLRIEIIIASAIGFTMIIAWTYGGGDTMLDIGYHPLCSLLYTLTPLAILVLANQLLVKIQKTLLKHTSLLIVVVITTFFWHLSLLLVFKFCA